MTSIDRKLGRPRDAAVDAAIVEAVLELLEEVGLGAMSMDAVAARAGVGKATIYRRWGSKEEMVIDAIANLISEVHVPQSGDLRADLVGTLKRLKEFMSDINAGSIFPWLVGEVASGSDVGRRYAEAVILPRRKALSEMIHTAQARGELRPDLDVDIAVDMLIGPAILRKIFGSMRPDDPHWEKKLVDSLLDGWRPG